MKCTRCAEADAMHTSIRGGYAEELCCRCYVEDGHPPADWHPYCMSSHERMKRNDAAKRTSE